MSPRNRIDFLPLILVAMLTEGSQGSTGGGLKLLRVLLAARTRLPSHAVSAPTLSEEQMQPSDVMHAAGIILLFAGFVLAS
jgi:Trk-type K+ transport system membrane component